MIWVPDAANVESVHDELVGIFSDEEDPISPSGVKSGNMLESACSRPQVGIGDHDKYKTVCEKVAALYYALIKNHPFHNGNKRTALVSALSMLHRNDFRLAQDVDDDAVYQLTLDVAANEYPSEKDGGDADKVVDALASWFRDHTERLSHTTESMKTEDFIEKCRRAGARVKTAGKGRSVAIAHNGRSVSINKKVSTLPGGVVMRYLRNLRLNESGVGIGMTEFQEGASGERQEIYRYMAALRRLAKT